MSEPFHLIVYGRPNTVYSRINEAENRRVTKLTIHAIHVYDSYDRYHIFLDDEDDPNHHAKELFSKIMGTNLKNLTSLVFCGFTGKSNALFDLQILIDFVKQLPNPQGLTDISFFDCNVFTFDMEMFIQCLNQFPNITELILARNNITYIRPLVEYLEFNTILKTFRFLDKQMKFYKLLTDLLAHKPFHTIEFGMTGGTEHDVCLFDAVSSIATNNYLEVLVLCDTLLPCSIVDKINCSVELRDVSFKACTIVDSVSTNTTSSSRQPTSSPSQPTSSSFDSFSFDINHVHVVDGPQESMGTASTSETRPTRPTRPIRPIQRIAIHDTINAKHIFPRFSPDKLQKSIEVISVSGKKFMDDDFDELCKIINRVGCIDHLRIQQTGVVALAGIVEYITTPLVIKKLTMKDNNDVHDSSPFYKFLERTNRSLEEIHMSGNVVRQLKNVQLLESLRVLVVDLKNIPESNVISFLKGVKLHKTLRDFTLHNVPHKYSNAISEVLSTGTLEYFDVRDLNIDNIRPLETKNECLKFVRIEGAKEDALREIFSWQGIELHISPREISGLIDNGKMADIFKTTGIHKLIFDIRRAYPDSYFPDHRRNDMVRSIVRDITDKNTTLCGISFMYTNYIYEPKIPFIERNKLQNETLFRKCLRMLVLD